MKKPEKKRRKKIVAMTATESYLASLGVSPRPMTLTGIGPAVRRYRAKIVS
jgi:hypothetical protein